MADWKVEACILGLKIALDMNIKDLEDNRDCILFLSNKQLLPLCLLQLYAMS